MSEQRVRSVKTVAMLLFAGWVWRYMREPEPLLHGSILIFHEAGHIIFMPFGEFMMVLGGSLFQLIVPLAIIVYFCVRRDFYAALFTALYLAASLHDVGTYIADARAGELPLLGGDRTNHDWTFLLIEMKRLDSDIAIGRFVHNLAKLLFWLALGAGAWLVWMPRPDDAALSRDAGDSPRSGAYPTAPRSSTHRRP